MARTTGPLMSLAASGSVAKTLTFAHWKGRPYVRQLVTPSNPRSAAQYYTRAMMGFLASTWKLQAPIDQASWADLAKQGNFSNFNAYQRANMLRWTQSLSPSSATPPLQSAAFNTVGPITATGGVGQISIVITNTTTVQGWGLALALDPANGATPALSQTRQIPDLTGLPNGSQVLSLITNLDAGTYSLCYYQFDNTGSLDAPSATVQNITVL